MRKVFAGNLDQRGYGVQGEMTRREWQELCCRKVLGGGSALSEWQKAMPLFAPGGDHPMPSYDYVVREDDGSERRYGLSGLPARFVLDLAGCEFDRMIDLSNVELYIPVLGAGAIFSEIFVCKSARFQRLVDFRGAIFKSAAIFRDSVMFEGGLLNQVSFQGDVLFDDVGFKRGIADFSDSTFAKDAYFDGIEAEFLRFDGATMEAAFRLTGRSGDGGRQGLGRAMFRGVQFLGTADFGNRLFLESTDFGPQQDGWCKAGARTYFKFAPRFYNSILHQDTSFADVVFAATAIKERGSALAFNVLRHSMQDQQNSREEQKFLRLQFDAEREESRSALAKSFYSIYRGVSDYGLSIARPAAVLLVVTVVAWWAMLVDVLVKTPLNVLESASFGEVLAKIASIAFLNSLPPIGLNGLIAQSEATLGLGGDGHFVIFLVVVLQRLLALSMWFFVALGLRNLFRLR